MPKHNQTALLIESAHTEESCVRIKKKCLGPPVDEVSKLNQRINSMDSNIGLKVIRQRIMLLTFLEPARASARFLDASITQDETSVKTASARVCLSHIGISLQLFCSRSVFVLVLIVYTSLLSAHTSGVQRFLVPSNVVLGASEVLG